MKKVLIGSVLTLVSSLWAIAIGVYVQLNLVMDWYGSRFWASAKELGVAIPLAASLMALTLGLVILGVEYFRKEK